MKDGIRKYTTLRGTSLAANINAIKVALQVVSSVTNQRHYLQIRWEVSQDRRNN